LVFLFFWGTSFLGSLPKGWQGRKRPTSLKTMGRRKKKKPMVFFLKAVGLKPAAFFVVNRHSVYMYFRYDVFVKSQLCSLIKDFLRVRQGILLSKKYR
jgi:hypothetical protein